MLCPCVGMLPLLLVCPPTCAIQGHRVASYGASGRVEYIGASGLVLSPCLPAATESFAFSKSDLRFRSLIDNRCIDIDECGSSPLGNHVSVYPCHSFDKSDPLASIQGTCAGKNQQWSINANGTITSALSGQCLAVDSLGVGIFTFPCDGSRSQQWQISGNAIVHSESGKCVTVGSIPAGITEVWAGPLSGMSFAVALLNRGDQSASITAQVRGVSYAPLASPLSALYVFFPPCVCCSALVLRAAVVGRHWHPSWTGHACSRHMESCGSRLGEGLCECDCSSALCCVLQALVV